VRGAWSWLGVKTRTCLLQSGLVFRDGHIRRLAVKPNGVDPKPVGCEELPLHTRQLVRSCAQDYGNGCGVVYKLDISKGVETVLYTFKGGADGAIPAFAALLVRDKAGNLYGTTMAGGNNQDCITNTTTGCGTLFKIDAAGAFSVLHFDGTNGNSPNGVMEGPKGNFYGTTYAGGNGCTAGGGCGTVFKFSAGRKESVLYNFQGQSDGGFPAVGVVEDGNHNLYGTTEQGGDLNCKVYGQGCGVIFEITAN
jgi:uncharacterized repeat protein (TIGR03803 family)